MTVWKGRFRSRLHPLALKFSSSLRVDKKLFREDIQGSLVHVSMLAKQKIISKPDATKIQKALQEIEREIANGKLRLNDENQPEGRFVAEDIHMAIEHRLIQKLGPLGGKLHTARSRNDQIALDERLYLRTAVRDVLKYTRKLQKTFVSTANRYRGVIMPGYTHLQRAQPILLAHHLLAYVSMLERDHERFKDCLKRVNQSPLGAGALAGTSFPIDRRFTAGKLGFYGIVENSIDAVADRDVQIEFLSACSMTMMHLSRFSEEIILWSSQEWDFVEIGDAFTTGSSIMPQKKNPDMAELIRGKTGRVYGDLIALLTTMKGLPLAYNRDMQEDKEPLFDAASTLTNCLGILSMMLPTLSFNSKRFVEDAQSDYMLATELADYLVRKGVPFRKAHSIVGSIVNTCLRKNISLKRLSLPEYQRYSQYFSKNIYELLDVEKSLRRKKSKGSTSPSEVAKAISAWSRKLR